MSAILPADGLYRLGVVVKDYKTSIREFSRFFGIKQWEITRFDKNRLSDTTLYGKPTDHSFVVAEGTEKGLSFELVQPLSGESVYSRFFAERGEGMHYLFTNVFPPDEYREALRRMASEGVRVAQSGVIDGAREYCLLDTSEKLAGALIQIATGQNGEGKLSLKPDEVVSFGDEVTGWNRMPLEKIYHVCIVTRNRRQEVKNNIQRLLGVERWFDFENETGVSSKNTTYYGRPCQSAFNLSLGRRNTLAIEVVEHRYGDNLYREMLEQRGEGLHHMMSTLCDKPTVDELIPWTKSEGMPIVQDGEVADYCYYGYLDARSRLAGILVEVLTPLGEGWFKALDDIGDIIIGP